MEGRDVKALRSRLRVTQRELAERVQVSPNTVARWERDEHGISGDKRERLLALAQSLPSGAAVTKTSAIVLDPHHRAIIDRLCGHLDPDVFELCAADILRSDWPALVPVRGGSDHGFDGAVADNSAEEPFPLVVTTGTRLLRNFTGSLDSAKQKGWKPRRALFATSRRITPATRRKLVDAAHKRGIRLAQTYDQDWFAMRLYGHPRWCKRLLGLSGRPHALSVFPKTRRQVLGDEVLGRDSEKRWLLEYPGDCVLVGQPGSGKTFLLMALALEGKALFLVDQDREQIANDLRSLCPENVIVDDAHVRPGCITDLVQLRSELGADFRIIATCWPGQAGGTKSELHVGESASRALPLVDADTMIQIIKSVGIAGPNRLLHAIRTQAAGRPGLAATLAHLCLIGDIRAATSGEGLVDTIAPDLDRLLGIDAIRLLAPFALGGDAGAMPDDVATKFGMSLLDASTALAKLGSAGIVKERNHSSISVEPPPMRWVLVRRVFFGGAGSLTIDRFLPTVVKRSDAVQTLVGARARGADVPDLEGMLAGVDSPALWAEYASLGPLEARLALSRRPEFISALAEPSLFHLPDETISLLLSRARDGLRVGDDLDAALQPLQRWIKQANSGSKQEAIGRRRTLIERTEAWFRQSQSNAVAIAAMYIALDPDFDYATPDPGAGTRITFSQALLDADTINQMAKCWPSVMTIVDHDLEIPWTKLIELVTSWSRTRVTSDKAERAVSLFCSRMLSDLASASPHRRAVQHCIAGLAMRINAEVSTTLDLDFQCLYPHDPYDASDFGVAYTRLEDEARKLAARWTDRPVDQVASFLARVEADACDVGITYPRFTPVFCETLLESHPDPSTVARVFMHNRLPADLVQPFLRRAVREPVCDWAIVSDCLEDPLYSSVGIRLAISQDRVPARVNAAAIEKADQMPQLLEDCCVTGEISTVAASTLLQSSNPLTAISVAIGCGKAHRNRNRIPLDATWQEAILRSAEVRLSPIDGYWIGEILKANPDLAIEWLARLLESEEMGLALHAHEIAAQVAASLDSAQRIRALTATRAPKQVIGASEVINALVGRRPDVYRHLLQSDRLSDHHLSPLMGEPTGDWRDIALLALDQGYSSEEVFDATQAGWRSWEGNESDMWAHLRQQFEKLQGDDDRRIASVGRHGASKIAQREQRAHEAEREDAIHGIA